MGWREGWPITGNINVLFYLAIILAAASLGPLALYIFRRGHDPLNPLILIGLVSFGIAAEPMLKYGNKVAGLYATRNSLEQFSFIGIISLLGLYLGWALKRHRDARSNNVQKASQIIWSPGALLGMGYIFAIVGMVGWAVHLHNMRSTGYVTDLYFLMVPSAVLVIQAVLLDKTRLLEALPALAMAVTPDTYHFLTYGGRGSAMRLAVIPLVYFLFRGKRPKKVFVLGVLLFFGATMHLLAQSRTVLRRGQASSRIGALVVAAEQAFKSGGVGGSLPGRTFVAGSNMIQIAEDFNKFDYGRFVWNMGITFLPHEWFPNKYDYGTFWYRNGFMRTEMLLGRKTPGGNAQSGFAYAFIEFWWFSPLFWLALGWWLAHLYGNARSPQRLDCHGYLIIMYIATLYLVAQDLPTFGFQVLFCLVPLFIAYHLCGQRIAQGKGRPGPTAPAQAVGV